MEALRRRIVQWGAVNESIAEVQPSQSALRKEVRFPSNRRVALAFFWLQCLFFEPNGPKIAKPHPRFEPARGLKGAGG